jgi:hypothetical protein
MYTQSHQDGACGELAETVDRGGGIIERIEVTELAAKPEVQFVTTVSASQINASGADHILSEAGHGVFEGGTS